MTTGERIRQKRKECGMTQNELAKAVGVTYQLISHYENNVVDTIPTEKLNALAKVFRCSPYELMEGVKEEPGLTASQLRLIARIKLASPEEADKIEDIVNIVLGKKF